jgi:hypothetical protein
VDDGHALRHLNLNGKPQKSSKQPRDKERQPDQMSHLQLRIMMRLSRQKRRLMLPLLVPL